MKNVKVLSLLLMLGLFASCEKDAIQSNSDNGLNTQQFNSKNVTAIQFINSKENASKYVDKISKNQRLNSPRLKMTEIIGKSEIYNDKEEFDQACSDLNLETFDDISNPGFIISFTGRLDENSNENGVETGDIISGISISSESGSLQIFDPSFIPLDGKNQIVPLNFNDKILIDFPTGDVTSVGMDLNNFVFTTDVPNITIEVYTASGLLHTLETPVMLTDKFWGINTEEPITTMILYSADAQALLAVDNITFGNCASDSDNDGCLDDEDPYVESNQESTILIGDCDTGIENKLTPECGVFMADIIDTMENAPGNHGSFVSAISHLSKEWLESGFIDKKEKSTLVKCAARFKD